MEMKGGSFEIGYWRRRREDDREDMDMAIDGMET